MLQAKATAEAKSLLSWKTVARTVALGLEGRFDGARVLLLIPDHTRTIPLPRLFPYLTDALRAVRQLDIMVALGTHPPLKRWQIYRLLGLTADEWWRRYESIELLNHEWNRPEALLQIGTLSRDRVRAIAGDVWHASLDRDVPIRINRRIQEYDRLLIIGPTFPHEVVGFSGGEKYLFPGISGPEMIDATHWLGALAGSINTIGIADTPVRRMIHAAAEQVPTPVTLMSMVVDRGGLAGLFVGEPVEAWRAAAGLSSQRHISWHRHPFERVLSYAPPMYDELWTAAKAMYKLEPVVADGGELVVYAPHLSEVSRVHGEYIYQIGYHVLEHFLAQWEQYRNIPLAVLAHSTHLRGAGTFRNGLEKTRIKVTLASQIPPEMCAQLNLEYSDPDAIDSAAWEGREDEGILFVRKAGEKLHRVRSA